MPTTTAETLRSDAAMQQLSSCDSWQHPAALRLGSWQPMHELDLLVTACHQLD